MIIPEELGGLLFNIHQHDEKTEKIIYFEEDLLPILEAIGLPIPVWGKNLTLSEYIQNRLKRPYTILVDDEDDVYTIEEWNDVVSDGSITNDDGCGYWAKNGMMCRDEVFSTPQSDATHVVWFNK